MYVRVCHAHANQTSVVRMALFVDSATRFGGVEADFFFLPTLHADVLHGQQGVDDMIRR